MSCKIRADIYYYYLMTRPDLNSADERQQLTIAVGVYSAEREAGGPLGWKILSLALGQRESISEVQRLNG